MFGFIYVVIMFGNAYYAPQPVLVGPIKLTKMILRDNFDKGWANDFSKAGLNMIEVVRQMNDWSFYILDYKHLNRRGEWEWYRPFFGRKHPQVLLSGNLSIELNDKSGRKVNITLTQVKIDNAIMNPRSAKYLLYYTLKFKDLVIPLSEHSDLEPSSSTFPLTYLRHDINGRYSITPLDEE